MALETSGFQLSQFDRAPNIPGNVGVVDTKSIYDSVTNALKQHEVFRTLQQVQGLNDASMAYQTAQAQGLLSNLPDTLAAQRAQSRLLSAEATAGLRGVSPQVDAQIAKYLLSSASDTASMPLVPNRAAAEKAKLKSEEVMSGVMADPEIARRIAMSKTLGTGTNASREKAIATLADPSAPEFAKRAAEMYLGLTAKAAAPGIGYMTVTGPDGSSEVVATNKNAVGVTRLSTGETIGVAPGTRPTMAPQQLSLLPTPAAAAPAAAAPAAAAPAAAAPAAAAPAAAAPAAAAPAAAAPAAAAPYVLVNGVPTNSPAASNSFWLGQSAAEKTSEKDISQIKSEWLKKLPALDSSIRLMELQVAADEISLDRALEQIAENPLRSTGIGAMLFRELGGSKALDLVETLEPVRTNIFTGELAQMRANSPTGGAVGNVTDVEGNAFKAALGSLNTVQSADQLVINIEKVRNARKLAVQNLKRTMSDYRAYLNGYGTTPAKSEPSVDEVLKLYK
jgi:hypothetical protein